MYPLLFLRFVDVSSSPPGLALAPQSPPSSSTCAGPPRWIVGEELRLRGLPGPAAARVRGGGDR